MAGRTNSWRNWNVAVSGMNANPESPGPGFAVARCLREEAQFEGRIIGLGYDVLDAGLYSQQICDGGYLVPYPSAGKNALLERLKDIQAKEHFDAIVPCLDAEIQNYIALEPELESIGIRMLLPRRKPFAMRAKDQLGKFCQSIGVDAPESKTITNPNFFDDCESHGWEYPLIVKGIFYDAALAHDAKEARAIMQRLVQSWGYPVLVQKVVYGDEFDLSAIGDGMGNMIGTVTMRKRALTEKGKAWAGVTVSEPGVTEAAARIISGLNWNGPFEVEVMRTQEEKIYLIEINPRFPAWIFLSHAVGRNLPATLLKVLAGERDIDFADEKTGTFFIRHAQELIVELPEFEAMLIDGGITRQRNSLPSLT